MASGSIPDSFRLPSNGSSPPTSFVTPLFVSPSPGAALKIRFDSLCPTDGLRSTRFERPLAEIVVRSVDEVIPALERIEAEVAEGRHAAGYVTYEAAPAMDRALSVHAVPPSEPLLHFTIFEERVDGEALAGIEATSDGYHLGGVEPALREAEYTRRIDEIQRLIAAGDTYQVNFTFPLTTAFEGSTEQLYADLCRAQASGYCSMVETGDETILSASPELFFRQRGRRVELRPMKGTRPRGRWPEEDRRFAADLVASTKDRAENLMIVDLLRNDLGRVAEWGSVEVPRLFQVEKYPTVLQMTSTVVGTAREETSLADLFSALFPCGSVTGAPKVRTMEIIQSLEIGPRRAYTGAIGFVSPGEISFSVAIRTLRVDRRNGSAQLAVGSGITADSDAGEEYRECLAKGAFLTYRRPPFKLLESIRLEVPGGYPLLDFHLDRAESSAEYFGYRFDRPAVRRTLESKAASAEPGVYKVRLLIDRDGSVEWSAEPITDSAAPVQLALAPGPVDSGDPFLFHKTTHRTLYSEAESSRPDADEVVLYNERGEVTETTRSNLIVELGGRRFTPPVGSGLLAGVGRRQLLRDGRVEERVITLDDLSLADRITVVNSVRGERSAELLVAAGGVG